MSPAWHCLLLLWFLLGVSCRITEIGCRDENNKVVDWFYMYKLPRNKYSRNPLINKGIAYMYITPQTSKIGWTLSNKAINETNSIPGLTLNELYMNTNILSLIYNDQWESNSTVSNSKVKRGVKINADVRNFDEGRAKRKKYRKTSGGGHTKGVIISDNSNGIWLIHSVPKYPPFPGQNQEKYSYPDNAKRYAQSFLCLTLASSQVNVVGNQLRYNEPKILHSYIPEPLKYQFGNVVNVIDHKTVKEPPWSNIVDLSTRGGTIFKSFAKSAHFGDDLYEGLVAPTFQTDLLVETWRNGPGVLPSNCTYKYKVNNIEKIAFDNQDVAFSSGTDHSKWAVSVPNSRSCKKPCSNDKWICVGDINRATSQESRGGGTVCLKNEDLWGHYSKSINSIQSCDGKTIDWYHVSLVL